MENLDNSGLNGVMIHNNGNKGIHIEYNPLKSFKPDTTLRFVSTGNDKKNNTGTISEEFVFLDRESNKLLTAPNLKICPKQFSIKGFLKEELVFDINVNNPYFNNDSEDNGNNSDDPNGEPLSIAPAVFWAAVTGIATCVAAGAAVATLLKKSMTKVTETIKTPDGKVYTRVVTIEDPEPFEIEVEGKVYKVDNWMFDCNEYNDLSLKDYCAELLGYQIFGKNLPIFEITDIKAQ